MVFQTEKALNEVGDKISDEEKSKIQGEIEKVKEALKGDDIDAIKNATESLQKAFYEISQKIYQQDLKQLNKILIWEGILKQVEILKVDRKMYTKQTMKLYDDDKSEKK